MKTVAQLTVFVISARRNGVAWQRPNARLPHAAHGASVRIGQLIERHAEARRKPGFCGMMPNSGFRANRFVILSLIRGSPIRGHTVVSCLTR